MMREIAVKTGNFRGVCPTIGRLSEFLYTAYIVRVRREPACLCAGFFVAGSDTHEGVDTRSALTVRRLDNVNFRMY